MVSWTIINSNQSKEKLCCATDTGMEVYTSKIHSSLNNALLYLAWYGNKLSIYLLHYFGLDIHPIEIQHNKLYSK